MKPQLEKLKAEPRQISQILRGKHFFNIIVIAGFACAAFFITPYEIYKDNRDRSTNSSLAENRKGDRVSESERIIIENKFMQSTIILYPVDADDDSIMQEFISSQHYNKDMREKIKAVIQNDTTKLCAITLWDNFDQDGDTVQVDTNGISITITLTHTPETLFIPYTSGSSVVITGVYDGGGGITAAFSSSTSEVPLPVMSVGQKIELPLL